MSTNCCQYIKTCTIYMGKEETISTPLTVYKNVFCKRGLKGWNNCKKYLEYQLGQ
jgi:hypothetical protein